MPSLLLFRHAKSDWGEPGLTDFDRRLNERGRRDARRMGRWMAAQDIVPAQIICSSAQRAQQTLARLNESLALPTANIAFTDRLYLANLSTLLDVLADASHTAGTLMLLGHNPGLEDLLVHLCGSNLPLTDKGQLLTTANLAAINLPDDGQPLAPACAALQRIVRPGDIGD